MNLIDTVEMMTSENYKERFKAEYFQLDIRIKGLSNMLEKYREETLPFTPSSSYEVLYTQLVYMNGYKKSLEERAKIENITL